MRTHHEGLCTGGVGASMVVAGLCAPKCTRERSAPCACTALHPSPHHNITHMHARTRGCITPGGLPGPTEAEVAEVVGDADFDLKNVMAHRRTRLTHQLFSRFFAIEHSNGRHHT